MAVMESYSLRPRPGIRVAELQVEKWTFIALGTITYFGVKLRRIGE